MNRRTYGVPYKGSKNGIVEQIIPLIPPATHFYDMFAGGCAVTHAALLSGKFQCYHCNDIDGRGVALFKSSIEGNYANETRWVGRDDFAKLKNSDPYISIAWSFGNNMSNYMYAQEIEPWKKALHYARVLGDLTLFHKMGIPTDGTRADVLAHKNLYKEKYIKWWLKQQKYTSAELDVLIAKCKSNIKNSEEQLRQYLLRALKASGLSQREVGKRLGTQMEGHYFGKSQWAFPTEEHYRKMQQFMPLLAKDYNEVVGLHQLWQRLQSLQSLQSLESLQSLQSLERLQSLQRLQSLGSLGRLESLERLQTSQMDYRKIKIEPDSVIYCDPPYIGTDEYGEDGSETRNFNHAQLYDWCCNQTELVLISEYYMPADRFACVWAVGKRELLSKSMKRKIEKLYVPRHQLPKYIEMMKRNNGTC